jgi:hypothetical protein
MSRKELAAWVTFGITWSGLIYLSQVWVNSR